MARKALASLIGGRSGAARSSSGRTVILLAQGTPMMQLKRRKRLGASSVAIFHPPDGFIVVAKRPKETDSRETDWTALRGRNVVIWLDGDPEYAAELGREIEAIGATAVEIRSRPKDASEKWDAADALTGGWSADRIRQLIETASRHEKAERIAPTAAGRHGRHRTPQRDVIIDFAEPCGTLARCEPNRIREFSGQ
jgi:hypothetical protein